MFTPTIGNSIEPEFWALINAVPKAIREIDGIQKIDPFELAKDYFEAEEVVDMSIDPNANVNGKSPTNFHSEIMKPLLKLRSYHLLWKNLKKRHGLDEANRIMLAVFDGLLYFHDITKIDVPYCFAPDTSHLMFEGRPYGWLPSSTPNKLRSFMGQLREMTMDFSQENAGAIGIANALVNLAYYSRDKRAQMHNMVNDLLAIGTDTHVIMETLCRSCADNEEKFKAYLIYVTENFYKHPVEEAADWLLDKEIEDEIQQTVHIFHNTFRIGGDSPFTNISLFDRPTILHTFANSFYPDGSLVEENIEEVMRVQKIYAKFFAKGSPVTGKPYRFPVTTINIKKSPEGKIMDREFFEFMADLNLEKCIFNWHQGEKIASCCRLTSDLAALKETIRMDSFGNGGYSIGSHRVVAINLHRVALLAKQFKTPFPEVLRDAMEMAEKLLVVHKEDILKPRVASGVLKFFNIKWVDINMFFSTFGFTGLYDAYEVLAGNYTDKEDYVAFAGNTLKFMETNAKDAGKRNKGFAFNVEEIPAENASPKLAKKDNILYGTTKELLSNQMVPLYEDTDLFDRLDISSQLMNIVSGGAILHLNVADQMTVGANRELLRRLIEDYNIPHFALNKGFSTCVNGHTTTGIVEKCPDCGAAIDTYTTRVVGFFTDTKDWVKARRNYEFPHRRWYGKEEVSNG